MATQTVEFQAVTGQSVTAKLFAVGSDTQVASVSATEATNRKGTYSAAYTDVAAGTYDLIAFVSTTPVARWQVVLTLTTATFQAYEPIYTADISAIKAVTDKVDTMVEVDGLIYRYTTNALEQAPAGGGGGGGTDWTADERTAIRTVLGIPGSGTTPANPSDGVLYDIKQKTDQIGSAGAITNLLAGAVLDPGTITSFPSELVIGDSYQETDGREIQIPLVDTDGNVLTTVGSRNLADATATFEIRRINESDSTRVITGVATIVDPPGTGTGAGAPYAIVELPADETAKGLVSYRYKGKLTLTWSGPGTDVYSFDTETIKFTY